MSSTAVAWDWIETALGRWLVGATPTGLARLSLGARSVDPVETWASEWEPGCPVVHAPDAVEPFRTALVAYAAGELEAFDLPLDLRGSDFEQAAWAAMQRIAFGRTKTYGELARELGEPGAARAIGRAAGHNPVPIVVP